MPTLALQTREPVGDPDWFVEFPEQPRRLSERERLLRGVVLDRPVRVEYRRVLSGSWFDPAASRSLSGKVSADLQKRTKTGYWQTVTLTYAEGMTPKQCYQAARRGQHVNKFIKALEKSLGYSLKGLWIRKLEFQMQTRQGMPHFHLLIRVRRRDRGRDFHAKHVKKCWQHGFTYVVPLHRASSGYFAKYISKGDDYPSWILLERARSVKVIATSPGFWRRVRRTKPTAPREDRPRVKHPSIYRCIGHTLGSKECIIRVDGRYARVPCQRYQLQERATAHQARIYHRHRSSWRSCVVPPSLIDSFLLSLWGGGPSRECGGAAPDYLIDKRNLTSECSEVHPIESAPDWFIGYCESLEELECSC